LVVDVTLSPIVASGACGPACCTAFATSSLVRRTAVSATGGGTGSSRNSRTNRRAARTLSPVGGKEMLWLSATSNEPYTAVLADLSRSGDRSRIVVDG
jgi:hypothetical protein